MFSVPEAQSDCKSMGITSEYIIVLLNQFFVKKFLKLGDIPIKKIWVLFFKRFFKAEGGIPQNFFSCKKYCFCMPFHMALKIWSYLDKQENYMSLKLMNLLSSGIFWTPLVPKGVIKKIFFLWKVVFFNGRTFLESFIQFWGGHF